MATPSFEDEAGSDGRPPAHPVPQLQGPFEESMLESVNDNADHETKLDSFARRTMLLEMPNYERVIAGRWKQKPGERFHPLWKITAQMSFGMHLLAEGMARSEEEVMKILQSHVDDIDGFLERTTEDFDLAQSDIQERLRYLKLPLEHVEVFDRMLEDRAFRISIVDGNEKIEHIVERTSEAMKDSLKDVLKGMESTKALEKYLSDLDKTWIRTTAEHEAVFLAMLGNVEGWSRAFTDLYLQGNKLGKYLVQLSEIVAEMQRRAGVVSRKMLIPRQSTTPILRQSHQSGQGNFTRRRDEISSASHPASTSQTRPPKPLPTAPETRYVARNSSRTTLQRQSPSTEKQAVLYDKRSSSNSGNKRGSGNTHSTPASIASRSSSPNTPMLQYPNISELAANDAAPGKQASPQAAQPRVKNIAPTELPAEVPEQASFQVPHSNKSRLSIASGVRSKDASENRTSQNMTMKSLGSLLKSPRRLSAALENVSPETMAKNTSTAVASDGFGTEALQKVDSTSNEAPVVQSNIYQADPGLEIHGVSDVAKSSKVSRTLSPRLRENLAFTSHPPDTILGAKPVLPGNGSVKPAELASELSGTTEDVKNHSRQESQLSSLGEPGPEIDDTEGTKPQPSSKPQPSTLLDAIARRTLMANGTASLNTQDKIFGRNGAEDRSRQSVLLTDSQDTTSHTHIAEMEGSSPVVLAPLTFGPVELEAPQPRLILPPRPAAQNADVISATITSQSDFFKLPTVHSTVDYNSRAQNKSTARVGPGHVSMPVPNLLKKADPARKERSSLPPRLSGSRIHRKEAPGLSRHLSDLIEHISYTPPDSPIHARSVSEASSTSARIMIERPSRSLGPPQEAPPPPAPGGRLMVSPDYATAGAFEGERRSKHSSGGGSGSWRKLLPGGPTTPFLLPTGARPGSSSVSNRPSSDLKSPGVNMMTAGGKDVLWFKGMSRDGVWVSSG